MALIFISHSSRNNDKAIEVRDWLAANGWTDVFLDLDPERGIVAGQSWKEALQKAAYRCEAVLALVSKEWLDSGWCKSEIDAARLMGKRVIVALVGIDKAQVPLDLTDEQFIDLSADPQAYRRLKEGLNRAGLDPTGFPFEEGRRPYPGFASLEEQDAAVFFGRDAQIVRGLDEIRRLARVGVARMLVILGASGSGKSSFLRAGLWPRLKRDDHTWLLLPILRPERAAISGKFGLAAALYQITSEPRFADGVHKRGLPQSRAEIEELIGKTDDGLAKLFAALREIAQGALLRDNATPPTILIALDQGEELFNEEGRDEARLFIDILTRTLAADPRVLAILAMRSDTFPSLQRDAILTALPKETFTLDMMLEGSYRAVIEGPAGLVKPPLKIDPQLTDALLKDISGQDALPLLAFTLAYLYDNYRADNELTFAGYEKIGRVTGVIDKTVAQAFAEAVARGEAPKERAAQLALARSAFIPHLAQFNAARQTVRRVAARDEIPAGARPLIDRFGDQRLLIRDRRKDSEGKEVDVVEVAHEALLRQPPLSDWLAEDREFLVWRDRTSQARAAFAANERGLLAGRELDIARDWLQKRAEHEIEPADRAFIADSAAAEDKRRFEETEQARAKEVAEREEQERRLRDAERIAEEQKKAAAAGRRTAQVAFAGLAVALMVAGLALWQYFAADRAKKEAQAQREVAVQAKDAADQAKKDALAQRDRAVQAEDAANKAKADALAQRDRAVQAEDAANKATQEAQANAEQAKANLRDAQISQSYFLAGLANQRSTAGDGATAVLLALEALPDAAAKVDRPYVPEAEHQLDGAWRGLRERLVIGQESFVESAAFSPDGKRIATASASGTARIWDAASGQSIGRPLRGHGGAVWTAAFSPDGKRIVTASNDMTARLWDAATGQPIGEPLRGHDLGLWSAAFSPDGKLIVTASYDKTARLWDAATGRPIGQPLRGHQAWVVSAKFSPDSQRVVTASADKTARIWDTATGQPIGEPLRGHEDEVWSAAFSPDGNRVVTASSDKTARIWDAASGQPIGGPLIGHDDTVNDATFSPDGKRIVTASSNGTVRIWDAATGQPVGEPLRGHNDSVRTVAFSPDGKHIITASNDATARLWDVAPSQPIGELIGHDDVVNSAAFSPDGKRIVTASRDKTTRVWDAATGQPIREPLRDPDDSVRSAGFSPDGNRIVTTTATGTARIWDAATGEVIGEPLNAQDNVASATFSPDGARIVTTSVDGTARVWDAATGELLGKPLEVPGTYVRIAAFSPTGDRIVTGLEDATARIWDTETGQPIGDPLRGHTWYLASAAFSPDGKRIVTASRDKTARLWDAATGRPIGEPLRGHTGEVYSAAFSPDGKRIVTASEDKTARLWDAATGQPVGELGGHDGAVWSAAFSPDGKRIVTASADKTARLWDVLADTESLKSKAKAAVPRCLTLAQRKALVLSPEPPAWCIEMAKWPYDTPVWKRWLSNVRAGKNLPLSSDR